MPGPIDKEQQRAYDGDDHRYLVAGNDVLLVEQNIDLMQTVAERAYALDKGRVVAVINREELRNTDRMAEFLAV